MQPKKVETYDLGIDRVRVDLGRLVVDQRLVLLHVLLVLGELLLALLGLLVDRPQLLIDGVAISILMSKRIGLGQLRLGVTSPKLDQKARRTALANDFFLSSASLSAR